MQSIAKPYELCVMDIMDQAVVTAPFTHNKCNDRCENQLPEPEAFDISTALIRQQASLNFPNNLPGVRKNFEIQPITTPESSDGTVMYVKSLSIPESSYEEEYLPANLYHHDRFIKRTPCYYKINKNGDTSGSERILSTLDPQSKNAERVSLCTFCQEHIGKASSTNASFSKVEHNIIGIIQISNTRCQECSVAGAPLEAKQSVHVPRRSSTEYDGHDDITYSNRTTNLYRLTREQGVVVTRNSNESFNSRQNKEQIRVAFMKYLNRVGKIIHMLLLVMRLLTMVVYLGYDVKCAMIEGSTFANCSQEFLVSNPKNWVIYSKTFSIISSLTLLFIIWYNQEELKYRFKRSFKFLFRNGSFWLTNFSFVFIFVYYIIRIDGSDLKLSIPLLIWWSATLVYCLNYLRPVNLPDLWFSLGYWFTIFTYVVETFCVFMAVTLASSRTIIPIITRDVDYKVKAFAYLVVLFRPFLASRFLHFFWYKVFNKGKDFFGSQS